MDQEKFDQHLMDYLFDELDEVTAAAMKRKIDSDADCRELEAGLRATLEVAQLPLVEPDEDLEDRILAAASLAEQGEPWTQKLLRSLSWAGSHAMRPQLAMAAILMLVVGSSVLLLRARPGSVAVTPMKDNTAAPNRLAADPNAAATSEADATPAQLEVAQQDQQPSAEVPEPTASAAAKAPSSATPDDELDEQRLAELDKQYDRAMANYNAGRHLEAQRDFAAVTNSNSPKASSAALLEARAVRAHSGCKAAVAYYNRVRSRFPSTVQAADATWEQADCHRILGETAEAKKLWLALTGNDAYKAQAVRELSGQGEAASSGGSAVASQRRAAPKAKPAAKGDAPEGGSGKKANSHDAYEESGY